MTFRPIPALDRLPRISRPSAPPGRGPTSPPTCANRCRATYPAIAFRRGRPSDAAGLRRNSGSHAAQQSPPGCPRLWSGYWQWAVCRASWLNSFAGKRGHARHRLPGRTGTAALFRRFRGAATLDVIHLTGRVDLTGLRVSHRKAMIRVTNLHQIIRAGEGRAKTFRSPRPTA